jgi:hypothetical protein
MKLIQNLLCSAAVLSMVSTAFAKEEQIGDDGYNKTYNDESKSFKDRMKEAREKPEITVANTYGGFTLGLAGDFGPVYDAEPESSSGMGFGFGVEPGYIIQSESWTRLEFGAAVGYHSFTWKSDKTTTATLSPFSVVPRVGIGHSLGNNLFGIVRFGFGFATGQLSAKSGGLTSKTDSKMGFVFSGDYDVTYGAGSSQFYGGIGATHYKYSFSESTTAGKTTSVDAPLNINHVNLHAGMRIKF